MRLAKQRRKTSRIFIFSRRVTRADRKIDKDRLANAGINIHIDADGLIRDNREPLRLGADMFACAVLHIQNIGAGRQGNAVVSIPVGRNPRDFFFPVLAEDDQRISV